MTDTLMKISEIFKLFESSTDLRLSNGTILICNVPHVAPKAYLLRLYFGLSIKDIDLYESDAKFSIPDFYKAFLVHHNGLGLFSDTLALYGIRKNYNRTGDDMYQPYDLSILNSSERINDASLSSFFFASYNSDGSRVYFDSETKKVYMCARNSSAPTREWTSFLEFLQLEVESISNRFHKNGRKIT